MRSCMGEEKTKLIGVRITEKDHTKYANHVKKFGYENMTTYMRRAMMILYEYDTNPANKLFNAVGEQYWVKKYGR